MIQFLATSVSADEEFDKREAYCFAEWPGLRYDQRLGLALPVQII